MTIQQKPTAAPRDLFALSHAQRGVWLDCRLIDDPTAYQVGCLVAFDSDIDADLARQAVRLMMGRHDGLRLRVLRDQPLQWVEPAGAPPFTLVDLAAAPDPETALREHLRAAQDKGFALDEEPLFRVDLIRLGPAQWRLLMLAHHLAADGVSIGLAQLYWLRAYRSLSGEAEEADGEAVAIPRSSYRPLVEDDEAYAASPRYQDDLAYWRTRLSPLPGLVLSGRPSPLEAGAEQADEEPDDITLTLDRQELAAFEAAATLAGTTMHRALLAIIAITLGRRYRRDDFALGMALHRRDLSSRHAVGMLAGMIPVRCRLSGQDDLQHAVRALAEGFDADLRHQRLPIDALGRQLAADGAFGDRADRALFDVAVTMMPATRDLRPSIAGRAVRSLPLRRRETSPLGLYVDEAPERAGLSIGCRFDPAVLSQIEVQRFASALSETLAAFASNHALPLNALDGLAPDERTQLTGWSQGAVMPVPDETLPALFARQVALQPEALAIITDGTALSYAELDAASTAIAAQLQSSGAQSGDVIGVCLPRSPLSVVALLGLLKAGCVYLPLDPAYPQDRLEAMIADAGAGLVIASTETSALLPKGLATLLMATDAALLSGRAAAITAPALTSASRAYIIYTSGSTGRPKGVAVSHGALVNLAFARRAHDPLGPGDRVLAAISIGFDVSLGQLLTPLLAGASIVIADDLRGVSGASFWKFLQRHAVTHVNSVPSFFETVLPDAPAQTALKQLMLGGEPLSGALATRLQQTLRIPVYNMYGPTEACIDATSYRAVEDAVAPILPIGRPLPNYSVHVLDAALQPVGIGAEGELCIGGAGLAEGYLNLDEPTAERFIMHPVFGRLYRTGDRGFWREDGELAFLGRSDAQVKIRGFRVEPGEVEAVLRSHPGIAQAAVIARPDARGAMRLLAYTVPQQAELDLDDIRALLQRNLPAHMVPAAITALPSLPLTHHGKLDERALPEPELTARVGAPPRTATEKLLAASFSAVLGLATIDTSSHFFDLGGHSLLATQLASKLRETMGLELPIRMIFEAPSLGDLAARIDALMLAGAASGTTGGPAFGSLPRPDPIPLSFEQERLWFLHKLEPASPAYNIPIAFRLTGALDIEALSAAAAALIARHESLRTRFIERDGKPEQIVLPEGELCFSFEDVSAQGPAEALRRARQQALRPFDLSRDPLLRLGVLALGEDDHLVLVTLHHIVSDGWSIGILQSELAALYRAAASGAASPLPPLPAHYADYALWQRAQLGPDAVASHLAFWTQELSGAPEQLTLPLDHQRPARRSDAGASCNVVLPPELSAQIVAFAKARQATPVHRAPGRMGGADGALVGAG